MRPLLKFLLLALPLTAQADPAVRLSLAETEALWRQNSRELRLAEANIEGSQADVDIAGQRPNPALSLNMASLSPWASGAGNWGERKFDNTVRVDQLIERGGKRELRIKGAEARLAASRLDYTALERQQRALLHRAYFDLLLAQEKVRITQEASALYGQSLDAAERRLKAGDIAAVDLTRLAIDKSRADNDTRQAQGDLAQARQTIAYLIGRQSDADQLEAAGEWPQVAQEPQPARIEDRPEIKAGQQRLTAAQSDRDLARALRSRDVSIGFQYEQNKQNNPVESVGIGISIPLFLWHAHEGEIRRAESDLNATQLQSEQIQAALVTQSEQARAALRVARDRLMRLEGGLLSDAERVAKAAEFAYGKGAMSLMDLLDARRTLRQVQLEALTARADYAKAWSDWKLQVEAGLTQ